MRLDQAAPYNRIIIRYDGMRKRWLLDIILSSLLGHHFILSKRKGKINDVKQSVAG
jgi:hypothetical protein